MAIMKVLGSTIGYDEKEQVAYLFLLMALKSLDTITVVSGSYGG